MKLTPEMSKALDEEMDLNIRKACFMLANVNGFTWDDFFSFVRNQMLNKAYPRIIAEWS